MATNKITATATVFPVLPGMTPDVSEFARELSGPRSAAHREAHKRLGFSAERAWVEPSSEGDLLVYYFEGDDIGDSFRAIGESNELHDLWFREKIYALTGVDLCDLRQLEPAELLFESPLISEASRAGSEGLVLPVLPPRLDDLKRWFIDLQDMRGDDFHDFLVRYDLARLSFFLRKASRRTERPKSDGLHVGVPGSEEGHVIDRDMIILYAEGYDPAKSIMDFSHSSHPFDVWMREELLYFCGVDFARLRTAPAPRLILDFKTLAERKAA